MKHTPLLIGLTLTFAAFAACSSGDSNTAGSTSGPPPNFGCITDPFSCAKGTTCWATQNADHFECFKSGMGKAGDACTNYYNEPTCADGLTCFAVTNFPEVCTPFCDPMQADKGCKNGEKCQGLQDKASGAQFYACAPAQLGSGGAGGSTVASSSASGTAASTGPTTASGTTTASSSASGMGGAGGAGGTGAGGAGGKGG